MIGTPLQRLQIAVYICALFISTSAIVCRILARRMMRARWQINDYLMLLAYITMLAMLVIALTMVFHGELGARRIEIPQERYSKASKLTGEADFVKSNLMLIATSLVRMSMTEFYLHIFPQGWVHRICYVQLVALAIFLVGQFVANLNLCHPIKKNWDYTVPGKCGDVVNFWLSVSIIALLFDVACVLLPMPIFWSMQLDRKKKWRLTILFGLGFIICGLTALRIWVYRKIDFTDPTYGLAHGSMLSNIEPALGILVGCIPIMAPCLLYFRQRMQSGFSLSRTNPTSKGGNTIPTGTDARSNPFQRLGETAYPLTDVTIGRGQETRGSSTEVLTEEVGGLGGIRVQNDIVIESSSEDDVDVSRTKSHG